MEEEFKNQEFANDANCKCETERHDKCRCRCFPTVLNIVLIIAVVGLYVLHFCGVNGPAGQTVATTDGTSNFKVGYIDTDSLILQYDYAVELNQKLERYTNMETNYQTKAMKFQEDYNNYLKTGAKLTLTEQKKTEESLKKRADEIGRLEKQLAAEQGKMKEVVEVDQKKMIEAVYAFIAKYNSEHQKFNMIVKKSFSESPVLYIDSTLDITREIIDGLNAEYKDYKSGDATAEK